MNDGRGKGRIGVGMSGGVDSSVAAALLLGEGCEVIGLTLRLKDDASRCVSEANVRHAREVADFLGIAHEAVDARKAFEETIVSSFVDEYAHGRTPSPCILCNAVIKFGLLLDRALEMGCEKLATGHYVRLTEEAGIRHLWRAVNHEKDQSYFLHRLTQRQLAHALFPLSGMTKKEVRAEAIRGELPVDLNSESQDLCFVSEDEYIPLVEHYHPELKRRGEIQNSAGDVLGVHEGFHRYTIGQRRGLGIAAGEPQYVQKLDYKADIVVVGPRSSVMRDTCTVHDINWISGQAPVGQCSCRVRIRYRHEAAPASVSLLDTRTAAVKFAEPQFAVTPGQAAVFYVDDEVLGGGWIGGND